MIEGVKTRAKPSFIRDMQMFIGFINFYYKFIQRLDKITALLTSILRKIGIEIAKITKSELSWKIDEREVKSNNRKIRNQTKPNKLNKTLGKKNLLISEAKLAFSWLKQAFMELLILYHFLFKHHIYIKTDAFGYVIGKILGQITRNNSFSKPILNTEFLWLDSTQWHLITFMFQEDDSYKDTIENIQFQATDYHWIIEDLAALLGEQ